MNKWIGMGRLTKDPDVRVSANDNSTIARFTLAVDRRVKREEGQQTADFISCVAFNKTAEWIEKYTKKGTKIIVTGRIQTGSYTNKDNQKIYTTDIIAEETEFAESKSSEENKAAEPPKETEGFIDVPVSEELPFK